MKLGEDTVGLRKLIPRLNGGVPVRDDYGDPVVDVVDVKVQWCQVTPSARISQTAEPQDRRAPALVGYQLLAPPDTDAEFVDVVVWPITGETGSEDTGDLALSGRVWQIDGEPWLWDESVEMQLRAST